ncbi:hypothetical protein DFQ11_103138 [Winogradskyella epiphytica]|uniref:Uncharacterized protein n=1 Tax=Winogradskyella epiphytica TaxID=262005 RepID=A0A2V4XYW5_9FLAO|nr:hypothetical protein DFQ11_103138 [Winogradskyella epiphytica]GGW66553.1 hypothetical protein GCM10008085_18010 [Winogradskyella epiphytica]
MQAKLVLICLSNFLVAALMGLALRYSFLEPIGINYRFLTHAHSHVAMLGWVYLMIFTLYVHYFIPNKTKPYNRLFWITEIAVLGMMISFPIQGYEAISISFSTLHIFCSYYFAYLIWKHHETESKATSLLIKASLAFMVLSTFGVWCLGPAVVTLGSTSAFYQTAIQFFLHFQFNGWFLIAVIAVLFHLLKIEYSSVFKNFFYVLIGSTILTMALPIHWFSPHDALIWINTIGVLLQIAMLILFLKIVSPKQNIVTNKHSKLLYLMYVFTVVCFILKVLFQIVTILPEFAQTVFYQRNFVIGFIHLLMLGVISGFLFSFILNSSVVGHSKTLYLGIYSFLIGFILTELLLLVQGGMFYIGSGLITHYHLLLFIFSLLLPLGIGLILVHIFKHKKQCNLNLKNDIKLYNP